MAIGMYDMTRPVYRADFRQYNGSNRTYAEIGTWTNDVILMSMHNMISGSNWNSSLKVVVYRTDTQAKVYDSGFFVPSDFVYKTPGYSLELPNPPTLYAGTEYAIGYYTNGGATIGEYWDGWVTDPTDFVSPYATWWSRTRMYFGSGDIYPSIQWRYPSMLAGGWTYNATNIVPLAPTGVAVTNSPVPNGDPANVQWTHNDPDGDPQSKYQLRWRKL